VIDLRKKKAEVMESEQQLVQKHHQLGDLGCAASQEGT